MTANVADNALLLEVIAGPDGYDPRQYNVRTHTYTRGARAAASKGMRIGIVTEGFQQANAEEDVNAKVRAAAEQLSALGATVERGLDPDASRWRRRIWTPIGVEGLTQTMM